MRNIILFVVACVGGASAMSVPVGAQTSPSAYTSATRYDVMGRATGTIAPDPDGTGPLKFAATRTTYDAAGRPIKVETGELANWQSEAVAPTSWAGFTVLSSVETSFDLLHRKTRDVTKGSDGAIVSVVQFSYDAVGHLECTVQRMNPTIYASLPASACTLGAQGTGANDFGPDQITKNVYDVAGQLLKIQKAVGTTLEEDYTTYTYSPNGKQTSLTDARGYKASMTYDGHDRQVKWNFPSKTETGTVSTTDYEEYGYDANGNLTSLKKRDGSTLTYQYDALNLNTVKVVPARTGLAATNTRDVYFGYDLRGLQTFARFDSAAATSEGLTTTYDGFGRMTSSALKMDGVTRTLSYASDKNGNRTELTWPDATKTSYAYDGLDRMTTLFEGALGSTTSMVGYTYNNRGPLATQTGRFSQVTTFGYDPVGRPNALSHNLGGTAQDVAFTYGYTPASQFAQQTRNNDTYAWNGHYNVDRTYAANGLNQYTSAGGATFTYDANGNLTSDGSTTYVYDIENRLVSASGAKNATLRYDPLGRLYEMIGGDVTTRLLHDGDELVAEYNAGGTLLHRYSHGSGIDNPVVWYDGTGTTSPRWLHTDHQGSVIAVTDGTGNTIATNSYDEYGIPAAINSGRFQYTGQAWVPELGMYYYKARIYSPTLGRFMQTDPIGYEDQINLYTYVGNDPVNAVDGSGEQMRYVLPPNYRVTYNRLSPPPIRRAPPGYRSRPIPRACPGGGCRDSENYQQQLWNNYRTDYQHLSIVGFGTFRGINGVGEGLGNPNAAAGRIQNAFSSTTFDRVSTPGTYQFEGGSGGLAAAQSFARSLGGVQDGATRSGGNTYTINGLPSGTTGTVATYQSGGGYARAVLTLRNTVSEPGSRIPRIVTSTFKVKFN